MLAAESKVLPLRLCRTESSHAATLCLARMNQDALYAAQRFAPFLHPSELARLDGMTDLRRHGYLTGRYCAKHALAHHIGITALDHILIEPGVFGQPLVRAPSEAAIRIGISHSADYACGLAFDPAQPMGIDLEPMSVRHEEAVRSQMTPAERCLLANSWRHGHACAWLWTVKEALGKALLMGLTVPIWMYEVKAVEQSGQFLVTTFAHLIQYKALSFEWNGALVTIVLPARTTLEIPQDCGITALPFFQAG
ncbi:4'-phosphopantetheinyl transferase superfamily protein [Lacisediminimonas sp.]|uniref:4'-phosphopantetheinyl transferase family protein n=1 Tax=Lacisediminimonas sp. TaxID=3060582 RepID=UPI002725C07F|nr:4'-phosphopantetheinyl transferase superfamily protein [Lacisediminimonas sp.]MDO8299355.1 4'-phosphopantetheinyl transferase superfamily protein [Lacisediminimonas sp.]